MPVPPGVVTWTLTGPAAWGLVRAEISVELVTEKPAVVVPKVTEVAPVNPVPVIVTVAPPLVVPEAGVRDVTVGGGAT